MIVFDKTKNGQGYRLYSDDSLPLPELNARSHLFFYLGHSENMPFA